MKARLTYILLFTLIPLTLMAQRQGRQFDEMLKKYKAERVAFLSDKLDLTVSEAEKFWPLYNEHQSKRENLMLEGRPSFRRPDPDSLTTEQMQELMDTKFKNDLKEAKLAQDYHKKYKEVLPIKKIFILYQSEEEFMSTMLRKMRGQHGGNSEGRRKNVPSQDGR